MVYTRCVNARTGISALDVGLLHPQTPLPIHIIALRGAALCDSLCAGYLRALNLHTHTPNKKNTHRECNLGLIGIRARAGTGRPACLSVKLLAGESSRGCGMKMFMVHLIYLTRGPRAHKRDDKKMPCILIKIPGIIISIINIGTRDETVFLSLFRTAFSAICVTIAMSCEQQRTASECIVGCPR